MRILVLSYFYPPSQAAGVVRIAKLTKFWARAGVDVTVLTSDDYVRRANVGDSVLERDVAAVHKVVVPTPVPADVFSWTKRKVAAESSKTESGPASRGRVARDAWVARARRVRDHVLLPDRGILWLPSALAAARRLAAERPFDVVFSSGNPWSNLVTAQRIARSLRVPYAIDFRDPWGDGTLERGIEGWTPIERLAHQRLEREVCRGAALITATTAHIAHKIDERCGPGVHAEVLENGFDPEDAADIPATRDPDVFRIGMTSQFRAGEAFRPFMQALRRCRERGLPRGRRLVFSFAGQGKPAGVRLSIRDWFDQEGLGDILEDHGFVPRREALRLQRSADLHLFVESEFGSVAGGMVGTEFYEYVATRERVLLLDDVRSAVWKVGEPAGTVRRCDREDEAGIERTLSAALEGDWRATPDDAWIERFSRADQARRLAAKLETLATSARVGAGGA